MTPAKTEQFLTVVERQGPKTWRWHLKSLNLTPRVGDDGAVGFIRNGRLMSDVAYIEPVRILDELGKDVTPDGARWSVAESGGRWFLELALDDATLPTPYVIDPAISNRIVGVSTPDDAGLAEVVPMPAGVVNGDVLIAQLTMRGGTDDLEHRRQSERQRRLHLDRPAGQRHAVSQEVFCLSRQRRAGDVVHVQPERDVRDLRRHLRLHRRSEPGQPDQHLRRPGERLELHCQRPDRPRRPSPTHSCSRSSAPRPATERTRTGRA